MSLLSSMNMFCTLDDEDDDTPAAAGDDDDADEDVGRNS